MKITGISLPVILAVAVYSCQNPSRETTNDPGAIEEPTQEERLDEPQVRDGVPETALSDSLATDTSARDTSQQDSL